MTHKEYWFWLCSISVLEARKIKALLEVFETPENLFLEKEENLKNMGLLTEKESIDWIESKGKMDKLCRQHEELSKRNIKFITSEEELYPKRLKEIYDYPYGLYVHGELPEDHIPTVAIIGARSCSEYGREMARMFGKELSMAGIQIISGMASGIDGAGHKGCIEAKCKTFGVLGCGVDICYPDENFKIYEYMKKNGGIISEFPVGSKPLAYHFPMRNRIISGLSDAIIVIEAKERSGSLITVDSALEQGKEIFALPGRICDNLSRGCNELIKNGAGVITSKEDILNFFHLTTMENSIKKEINITLTLEEKQVLGCLDMSPKHIQEITEETMMESRKIINILIMLELNGFVKQTTRNYYIRQILFT